MTFIWCHHKTVPWFYYKDNLQGSEFGWLQYNGPAGSCHDYYYLGAKSDFSIWSSMLKIWQVVSYIIVNVLIGPNFFKGLLAVKYFFQTAVFQITIVAMKGCRLPIFVMMWLVAWLLWHNYVASLLMVPIYS